MALHDDPTGLCGTHVYLLCYVLPWFQASYQASFIFCPWAKLTITQAEFAGFLATITCSVLSLGLASSS